jgi:hypothetical protein
MTKQPQSEKEEIVFNQGIQHITGTYINSLRRDELVLLVFKLREDILLLRRNMVNIHNLSYATTFSSLKSFNERGNLK